jgi:hypothetical protein
VLWGWNVSKNTKKRIALVVFEIKGLILVSLCGFKKLLFDFSLIFMVSQSRRDAVFEKSLCDFFTVVSN